MGGLTLICFACASYAELDPGTTQCAHEPKKESTRVSFDDRHLCLKSEITHSDVWSRTSMCETGRRARMIGACGEAAPARRTTFSEKLAVVYAVKQVTDRRFLAGD